MNSELDAAHRRLADIRRRLANLRADQAEQYLLKQELPPDAVRRKLRGGV